MYIYESAFSTINLIQFKLRNYIDNWLLELIAD